MENLLGRQLNYTVRTPVYEGPLDLLLSLIERAELDITTVSLASVTDSYLSYITSLEQANPDEISAFLLIAAKLLQIKSEALLPRPPARQPGEEDAGQALVDQLKLYKRYKEIGMWMHERQDQNLRTFLRIAPPPKVEAKLDLSNLTLEKLVAAAEEAFAKERNKKPLGMPGRESCQLPARMGPTHGGSYISGCGECEAWLVDDEWSPDESCPECHAVLVADASRNWDLAITFATNETQFIERRSYEKAGGAGSLSYRHHYSKELRQTLSGEYTTEMLVAQLRQDLENADIDLKYRRNQLFPSLDLIAGYTRRGASTVQVSPPAEATASVTDALDQFTGGDNPTKTIGVIFSLPLGLTMERGNYRTSKHLKAQAALLVKQPGAVYQSLLGAALGTLVHAAS